MFWKKEFGVKFPIGSLFINFEAPEPPQILDKMKLLLILELWSNHVIISFI